MARRHHALWNSATSAVIVVVLLVTLLALIHVETPTASAHAKTGDPETTAGGSGSSPGGFGSGTLAPWQAHAKVISSVAHIRHVIATDGVVLFGDSIAVQDGAALGRLLAERTGALLAEHSWSGEPTSAAVDALAVWAREFGLPHRIVMAVGSNDIFDPAAFTAQVDRAMRIAGSGRTVYWVNVQVSRTDEPDAVRVADQRNSEWIDLQLAQAQQRYPNLRIVHWAEYLAARPSRVHTLIRDGRHTTVPAGQTARNTLILQAIQGR